MKRKACGQTIDFSLSDLEDSASEFASVTIDRLSADRRRILRVTQDDIRFSPSCPPSTFPPEVVYHDLAQLEFDSTNNTGEKSKRHHGGRILLSVRQVCMLHTK